MRGVGSYPQLPVESGAMAEDQVKPKKQKKAKKRRWYHNVWEVFQMVRRDQPSITYIMLGLLLGPLALGITLGALTGHPLYGGFIGLMIGILAATIILGRRAESVAYARLEGQPGAVASALGTIRRGWIIEEEPVAVDPRTRDLVFRAVGRPGVVLISEGPSHRVSRLLDKERKRITRVIPNVPVTFLECGRDEGQIPLPKIAKAVQKQKRQLTTVQVAEIGKRLQALKSRPLPIPAGVDPMRMRPDRKGLRGR